MAVDILFLGEIVYLSIMSENRPWLKNYPNGIPANIDPDAYCSVLDLLEETFDKYRKKEAFACMGKAIIFDKVDKQSARFGAYLHSRGLKPGDKIALMMPNLLQYPIALFGALRAGLIVVNTNPLYTSREMLHQFSDSGVKAIVIAENFAANLQKIISQTQITTVVITSIGELLGWPKGSLVNFVVRRLKRMVPKYELANVVQFKECLNQGKKFTLPEFDRHPDTVILHQYTGGTTGISKGAMLTNKNLVSNMLQMRAVMLPFLEEGNEVALSPLPMYHIFAFTVNVLGLMSSGMTNVLITNPRDLKTIVKAFKKYPISLMTGVNTLYNALLNHNAFRELDFSALKITIGGGMAVQQKVAEEWHALTNCHLSEGYGMTEASPVVSVNPLNGSGKLGSIGLPVPSTDVRVVDENNIVLPSGSIGEIQVKGPQVMKGYFNKPEESQSVLKDGWLCTGDIGKMQDDGFFQIVDRKKDMILVSGFNVFPNEVEEVVIAHPKVLEVAVIGIPSEKSGEAVKLFVVKKDKSLSEKELLVYCKENLTGYKIPKEIEFRKELPKSNVGKILRRILREEAMA